MSASQAGDGYHHGDLRAACLDAAMSLLEEGTEATLSLRAVARRAGVSANAPYRHYRDKDELLAALATTWLSRICESSCPTPTRRLPPARSSWPWGGATCATRWSIRACSG